MKTMQLMTITLMLPLLLINCAVQVDNDDEEHMVDDDHHHRVHVQSIDDDWRQIKIGKEINCVSFLDNHVYSFHTTQYAQQYGQIALQITNKSSLFLKPFEPTTGEFFFRMKELLKLSKTDMWPIRAKLQRLNETSSCVDMTMKKANLSCDIALSIGIRSLEKWTHACVMAVLFKTGPQYIKKNRTSDSVWIEPDEIEMTVFKVFEHKQPQSETITTLQPTILQTTIEPIIKEMTKTTATGHTNMSGSTVPTMMTTNILTSSSSLTASGRLGVKWIVVICVGVLLVVLLIAGIGFIIWCNKHDNIEDDKHDDGQSLMFD
jgi:hypothetical protein